MPSPVPPRAWSFDVFDTCLARGYAAGVDLITVAARRSLPPGPDVDLLAGEAVRLRMKAEARACADGRDAALLSDIYAAAPELRQLGIDPDAMCALETDLERRTLQPIAVTQERVSALRAAGERVLFVSDMHLPATVLKGLLVEHGFARPHDPLYVSGEVGLSKLTGRLYDHVLREQGLRPDELEHSGDDVYVDTVVAGRHGLRTRPFPEGRLNRYERQMTTSAHASADVRSRLAGAARLARLGETSTEPGLRAAAAVGADVVGPLLAGFVRWVLDSARSRGLRRLCFVSRDGQVLHEIAQAIRRPDDPECVYVYGSRQAWLLPGVTSTTPSDFEWVFWPPYEPTTVRRVLRKLDLEAEELLGPLAAAGFGPDDDVPAARRDDLATVLSDAGALVRQRVAARQEVVRGYFAQQGLAGDEPWGLVDVGWRLNNQAALRTVLGPDVPFSGYYLALDHGRRSLAEAGWHAARVREDWSTHRTLLPGGWLLDELNIVEHVFARADHGQCAGYELRDGRYEPVLHPARQTPEWLRPMRDSILRFARLAAEGGLLEDGGDASFAAGAVTGQLFVSAPTREEALVFGATLVSDDHNEGGLRPLAPPMDVPELGRRMVHRLHLVKGDPDAVRHWDAARRAAAPPAVRAVLAVAPLVRPLAGRMVSRLQYRVRRS